MMPSMKQILDKVVVIILLPILSADQCPRDRSRVVRMVISKKIHSIYEEAAATMPLSCPLVEERDIYAEQEKHKTQEHPSHWTCGFCGKAFYEERYLDKHFQNKHAQFIRQGTDSVCLADFCEIFRCEVVGKWKKPEFWDKALCKETKLVKLKADCKKLLRQCVPENLSNFQATELEGKLSQQICDYLTCDRYWEPLEPEMEAAKMAAYILAFILLTFGLLIYYFLVYTHYYDDPFFEHKSTHYYNHKKQSRLMVPENNEIRYRYGTR